MDQLAASLNLGDPCERLASGRTEMYTRDQIDSSVGQALNEGQFEVYYQPQYSTTSMEIIGFEALVRWQHPNHGVLLPSRFLECIERDGMLGNLGEFVLASVCEEMLILGSLLGSGGRVSVNVSPFQLEDDFPKRAVDLVTSFGIKPSQIEFELTESVMEPSRPAESSLGQLSEAGFRLAIDDFGSGYSSLGRLSDFPFDRLKLDKSLLRGVFQSVAKRNIFESVVCLAKKLNMDVVAEGIETVAELNYVTACGVAVAQGFLFSPALPVSKIRRLFEA